MTRRDWKKDQARFLVAHAKTGIGPKEWCEQEGIKFSSGKRYIKIAGSKSANSQNETANETANSQKEIALKKTDKLAEKKPEKIAPVIEFDTQEETFNPSDFGLTGMEGKFAELVAGGAKLIDAYLKAGYSDNPKTAYAQASKMVRKHNISRAIRWLRDCRQKRLALTERDIIHQLSSIASADPNLISQIRRVNCRYCWGDDHQYQWRDVDEYERACASALAESKAPPSFDGGVGFVDMTIPNEDCPRCNGEGRMETFFADTSMLDGPERWLVTGVEETKVGLKVNMASPEAARKELLKIINDSNKRELELLRKGVAGDSPVGDMSVELYKKARREMLDEDDC